MASSVEISEAGRIFGIGRGERGYGIWRLTQLRGRPLEQFGAGSDGWFAAHARLRELEEGRGAPAPRRAPFERRRLTASLWVLAVALGIASLFPTYTGSKALANVPDELTSHLFYLVGWALAAGIGLGPARYRSAGALFGIGLNAVALGFFLTDGADAMTSSGNGAGLALGLVAFLFAAIASVLALGDAGGRGPIGHLDARRRPVAIVGGLFALGAAIAFAPSWDRFVVDFAASGTVRVVTLGNAFSNPGLVVAANVLTMALIVAIPLVALGWSPARHGAALLAGGLVPLVAVVVSAVVQLHERLLPSFFGISAAEAATSRLRVTTGLTGVYFAFACCIGVLVLLAGALAASAKEELPSGTSG